MAQGVSDYNSQHYHLLVLEKGRGSLSFFLIKDVSSIGPEESFRKISMLHILNEEYGF